MADVLCTTSHFDGHYRSSPSSPRRRNSMNGPINAPTQSSIPRTYNSPTESSSYLSHPSAFNMKHTPSVNKVAVPQAERNHFLFGGFDGDADDDLDFPVYDYAVTITPDASPDLEPSSSTFSSTSGTGTSSNTVSPPNSPGGETPILVAFDDNTIRHEPSRHVDYLSHDWKEEDIWSSWRFMIGKRNVYQNSARLENASWRTWAKAKYGLKTLAPEKLNWLKDCDVTWLYGPLSTGDDKFSQYTSPTSPSMDQPMQSLNSFAHKKPILKKRSMSEVMLQRSLSTSSLLKQAAAAIHSQQSESRKISRPSLATRAHSDFTTTFPFSYCRESEINTNELPSALSTGTHSPSYQRHIHFNNRVEQCIAVDKVDEDDSSAFIDGLDDDDSSEDGLVMMATSKNTTARNTPRGSFSDHQTIAMLPSTTLKPVDEPEIPRIEASGNGLTSFLSSSINTSMFNGIPSATVPSVRETISSPIVQSNFLVDDDDDDELDDYAWQPKGAFANRRDSIAIARPKFAESKLADAKYSPTDSDSEDAEVQAGLFGRAVDAVNTARDIAHVLWNVGWRK